MSHQGRRYAAHEYAIIPGAYSRLLEGWGSPVFRKATHRRFVAWLAMAAIWLTVVAPVISQTLPVEQAWPDQEAWCTSHGLSDQHPSMPSDPSMHMDKCGYCALLGHSPLLSGSVSVALQPSLLAAQAPTLWTPGIDVVEPILSANPRGPPLTSNG